MTDPCPVCQTTLTEAVSRCPNCNSPIQVPARDGDTSNRLVEQIRRAFPAEPIPPYPPQMGLDPTGELDEYAGFADTAWDAVEPRHFVTFGYDISPAVGFAMHRPAHMWNYHVPGFMTASLLHEGEHEITDGFMWRMREVEPGSPGHQGDLPWWHGERPFELYDREQTQCVIAYLEFIRDCGAAEPWAFEWELTDELALQRWLMRSLHDPDPEQS